MNKELDFESLASQAVSSLFTFNSARRISRHLKYGVALVVTAIPSEGPINPTIPNSPILEKVGGVGESSIGHALAELFDLSEDDYYLRSGTLMRRTGAQLGHTGADFYTWRQQMESEGNFYYEQQVDEQMVTDVILLSLAAAKIKKPVVAESKLLALQLNAIQKNWLGRLLRTTPKLPAIVKIGVTADDHVATLRMARRELGRSPTPQEITEFSNNRAGRFKVDQSLYHQAHSNLITYNRANLLGVVDLVVDNSAEIQQQQRDEYLHCIALAIIRQIATVAPEVNSFPLAVNTIEPTKTPKIASNPLYFRNSP